MSMSPRSLISLGDEQELSAWQVGCHFLWTTSIIYWVWPCCQNARPEWPSPDHLWRVCALFVLIGSDHNPLCVKALHVNAGNNSFADRSVVTTGCSHKMQHWLAWGIELVGYLWTEQRSKYRLLIRLYWCRLMFLQHLADVSAAFGEFISSARNLFRHWAGRCQWTEKRFSPRARNIKEYGTVYQNDATRNRQDGKTGYGKSVVWRVKSNPYA